MKNKITLILVMLLVVFSCEDNLDTTPTDRISDKVVWENEANVTLYINAFYPYIDRYGNYGKDQFKGNLTEGLTETLKYGSYVPGSLAGDSNNYVFTPETISSTGNLLDVWSITYERIRRVNEFLTGLETYSKLSVERNELFEGEARFFRAFLYFQLAKRHDGVILYTDMNLEKDKDRSTQSETWDLIAEDLDFAASKLPEVWDAANLGRVTKGAALAFKSRAMLYAERWELAMNAADQVLELGKYNLVDTYDKSWRGGNQESILEYNYLLTGPSHTFDKDYATYGEIENLGGSGTPTQEMVESYEDQNGNKIDWSTWHVGGGTTLRPPYENLEPRFQATVIYNGSMWKGKMMENSVDGTNGRYMGYRDEPYAQGKTTTGYYLKKYRNEAQTDLLTYGSTLPWVELRLAEVYLNRAEASFRLGNTSKALSDINTIRARPGVNLPPKIALAGDDLFKAIMQERKIELAYEGHLYWDMRRWKLAHTKYDGYRVHGIKINKTTDGFLFQYVDVDLQDRKFLQKTYVLPIPYNELSNNSKITQYEQWR